MMDSKSGRHMTGPLLLMLCLSVLSGSLLADDAGRLLRKAGSYFEPLPASMPGAENDTPARIELGRRLYHEPRLSNTDTQSCSSCHPVEGGRAGMDNLPTSPGAAGQQGTRNSPTVLNAGWQFTQFWDGRAADLADQAGQPILNPIEMGMPDEQAVIDKLAGLDDYPAAFAAAFPDSTAPLSYANLREAIAAFERTLRSESRFDDFLAGDTTALSAAEQRGLASFIGLGCAGCHDGPLLGGGLFEILGKEKPYHNTQDQGRFEVTGNEADRMVFKVAPLRNVALTGPWFHDGTAKTLEEAVRVMADIQHNRTLDEVELADLVTFLGALTGKELESANKSAALTKRIP